VKPFYLKTPNPIHCIAYFLFHRKQGYKSTFLLHELKTRPVLSLASFETSETFSWGQVMARASHKNNKDSIIFGFVVPLY
jgi:hypothetical protein